jgi:hypothetical protein
MDRDFNGRPLSPPAWHQVWSRDGNHSASIEPLNDATEQGLADLYRATTFRVDAPDGVIDIRVGNRHAGLDALLSKLSVTDWAFITAWNPGSRLLSLEQNEAAQEDLIRMVRDQYKCRYFPGSGIPDNPGWTPERSVWIAGISGTDAASLGERFGQNAIVVGAFGAPAKLLFCD